MDSLLESVIDPSKTAPAAPVNSIKEKLAQQISPTSTATSSNSDNDNAETDIDTADVKLEVQSDSITTNIDDAIDIDPSFILEDETMRNTQFNATLYDESSSSLDLKTDQESRLMESTSSLSITDNGNSQKLLKPAPIRPSLLTCPSSPATSSGVSTPVLRSLLGTPIRSNLKTPLQRDALSSSASLLRTNANYERRILFDTLKNDNAHNLQMILKTKHKHYKYTRISRTFLCGYDDHEYSETALKWAIEELMDDGDTIVCLKVIHKDEFQANTNYQLKNENLLDKILEFNKLDKKISILLEISISQKVSKKILQLIKDYDPSLLIVGTSGVPKKGFKNIISPKSMSKYCLQYSEIPVVVVRPNYKPFRRTKSCLKVRKVPKKGQSLDQLVMDRGEDDSDVDEEEEVEVDEQFYINLIKSFRPSDEQEVQQPRNDERQTRSSSRRPHSMFIRTKSSSSVTPSPSQSPSLTPVKSTDILLKPVRSRGFSPVRSLSPFWRKKQS